jgi:hypothetical protein
VCLIGPEELAAEQRVEIILPFEGDHAERS